MFTKFIEKWDDIIEKIIIFLFTIASLLSVCCGCGNQSIEENKTLTTEAEIEKTSTAVSVSVPEAKKITGAVKKAAEEHGKYDTNNTTVKTYSHSNKAFTLKDCSTSLFMVNGWEILSGGTLTDQQSDEITSFPTVLQYLDTKTTLKITVADEVEEKELFLAGTEHMYIETYGSAYDSIDITEFEQITIDEFDSFRIKADVVFKGEKFTMIHVISNDVSEKSFSWMLLDSDGEFDDFDLVEAISYSKIVDMSKFERFDAEDFLN